jgi:hypothetical protein
MKEFTVEQLEWLITLTEERIRQMVESPERAMLEETAADLRAERVKVLDARS